MNGMITDEQRAALRAAAAMAWSERHLLTDALPEWAELEDVRIVSDLLELAEETVVTRDRWTGEVEHGVARRLRELYRQIDMRRAEPDRDTEQIGAALDEAAALRALRVQAFTSMGARR